jgi:DNA-binding GntR family transcriptional regulator
VPLVVQALRHFSQWELARSSLFHHLIAEAISAREPERAARLMTEHVLQGRDALLERLAGRDAVGSDLVDGA